MPGESVYGEKRIALEEKVGETVNKIEYRVWNVFRSKLAASIVNGISEIFIQPGARVLYLGAASGTTVSHVSDIVGEVSHFQMIIIFILFQTGIVYAVEYSPRSGRDLVNMAKKRINVIPIIEDARKPYKYRMVTGMVDVIFADVAQPDQARIIVINAQHYQKNGGGFVFSIKVS